MGDGLCVASGDGDPTTSLGAGGVAVGPGAAVAAGAGEAVGDGVGVAGRGVTVCAGAGEGVADGEGVETRGSTGDADGATLGATGVPLGAIVGVTLMAPTLALVPRGATDGAMLGVMVPIMVSLMVAPSVNKSGTLEKPAYAAAPTRNATRSGRRVEDMTGRYPAASDASVNRGGITVHGCAYDRVPANRHRYSKPLIPLQPGRAISGVFFHSPPKISRVANVQRVSFQAAQDVHVEEHA